MATIMATIFYYMTKRLFKILKKIKEGQGGVSLLELIVSISLFTLVVLSSVQIFNMTMRVGREIMASQRVQKETRYLFEVISKEIRMAQVDKEDSCITQPNDWLYFLENDSRLKFLNKNEECVEYYGEDDNFTVERNGTKDYLTSGDVIVKDLRFNRIGYTPNEQPLIAIKMKVYPQGMPEQEMVMQTSISARDYE